MLCNPVAHPSDKFNPFKKLPNLLFLYLREHNERASLIVFILIERSGPKNSRY